VTEVIAVVVGYLLGSIPFAFLAGLARGVDLRKVGSGNLGAANVFRTLGRRAGIAVMLADIAKGVAAVLIARALTDETWAQVVTAVAAVLGHVFPVWLGFRGGKGVAVAGGALIGLMPWASLIILTLWALIVVTTRYTSLASITCAVAVTPVAWALGYPWPDLVFAAVAAALVLVRHRGNISRLVRGQELRIELRRPRRA
jgi:glycerol-3-phosphate acyltransferase PlsY